MPPIIGLVGAHAVGKTTAVRRWTDRYSNLVGVLADNQIETHRGIDTRVVEWKGSTAEKGELLRSRRLSNRIHVVDTCSDRAAQLLGNFEKSDPLIVVTCSWKLMGILLKARSLQTGRKFNDEYWTKSKLEYESERRIMNYIERNRSSLGEVHLFKILSQADDWPTIDAKFGEIFRRLNNLRRGS